QLGSVHVIVGQTMASVVQARNNLMLAELLVGPALLVIVFAGAFTIGRRVATPIELARQRQLEFTGNASHELRTPLSVIEAQASLALSGDRDVGWYRAAFGRVSTESKRMRRLVDDLLWLARFDAGRAQPESEPVDIGLLAQQAVDRFVAIAETRRQRLGLEVGGASNVVRAPADWLDHLAGVLIDNACRYAPDGGAITVSVRGDDVRVRLTVDDSGPGIPAEARSRIFERFHRASDSPGGSGLGLSIANAIVRATGGTWEIGDSASGGASMAVSWPPAFPRQGHAPAGAAGSPVIQPTGTPAQG
ncbi:MAG: two-component system, OmpR family, sensor histidine kinase TctE, partial [Chloroflexota bacterium]|nr:two-component system, OmpR family, sensor histidine kinase TctE [Chloroflexota bacterium]